MSGLFGGKNQVNDTTPPATSLRVQTSVAGKPRAIVTGQIRLAPNLIDSVDFKSETHSSGGGGGGGKGFGGGSCVAGEMPIEAPGGAKRLDAIRPGDVIWSLDPASGERVEGRVQAVLKHPMAGSADKMLRVHFVGRRGSLHITTNHYPWIDGVCRRPMKDWNVGEALIHFDGNAAVINGIHDAPDVEFTYNLVVEPHHNFFAGGVLLHNGFGGGGGKGQSSTEYFVSPVLGVCEGPIASFIRIWNSSTPEDLSTFNFSGFTGSYPGAPSGYMETAHPERAFGYAGLAYLAGANSDIGTSPNMPNINVEVLSAQNSAIANSPDNDPALWIVELASNQYYGAGFPSARIGDLTAYSNFCKVMGLVVSDALTDQRALSDYLNDLAEGTYSEFVFVDGALTLVPRWPLPGSANGFTYTPDPDLTWPPASIDDFLPNTNAMGTSSSSSALGNDPVIWVIKRRSELNNQVTVNCYDRSTGYNPNPQIAQDLGAIEDYGLRAADPKQYSFFAVASAALASAVFQLEREQIDKTCSFTLGMKYAELAPMDILPGVPLPANAGTTSVRIIEIQQNNDFTFSVRAEELPGAAIAPPTYNSENPNPVQPGINVDPGPALPIIFEPPESLSGEPEVWIMANGQSDDWSGCEVYLSFDNATYSQIGAISNPARAGVLAATLPTATPATFGATIDTASTLAVELFGRNDEIDGATQADALRLVTASYVDGEIIAYQNATLTDSDRYALTNLVRGAYGTTIGQHLAGTQFARIDDNEATIVKMAFTPDRVGEVCYLKFVSFNQFGGGGQELASVPFHTYVIQGAPITVPLPDVEGLQQTVDVNNVVEIFFEAVIDILPLPRTPIDYEIRFGGATPQEATLVGRTSNTSFPVPSDGLYWVAAHYAPVAGVDVYSGNWASITVTIPIGLRNLLTQDLAEAIPAGWAQPNLPQIGPWYTAYGMDPSLIVTGSAWQPFYNQQFAGGGQPAGLGIADNVARLAGTYLALADSSDFFAPADFFAPSNVFPGPVQASGRYIISPLGFGLPTGLLDPLADCTVVVIASYTFIGVPIFGDFFAMPDFFYGDDFLQWTLSQRASIEFQYGFSNNGFPPTTWTTFQPGQQIRVAAGQRFYVSVLLATEDPNVQPQLSHLMMALFGVDQIDRFPNVATGVTQTLATPRNQKPTISFVPLDQQAGDVVAVAWVQASGAGSIPAAFGGGASAANAYTGFTITVTNGGVGVTRHFDCTVIGF